MTRSVIGALFLLVVCIFQTSNATKEKDSKATNIQPHLILIVADDLGWNDISWHNKEVISPNLDALANGGLILNRSYVQPICTPTRSALMTSRFPFTIGRQNNVIFPPQPTGLTLNTTLLPEELKKLGYDTHMVGKWHLGFCKWDYTPTYRGFDSFVGFYSGREDYYEHIRSEFCPRSSNQTNKTDEHFPSEGQSCSGYDFRKNTSVFNKAKGNYSAFQFAERVEEIVSSRDASVPMFLYLPFQSVHAPLQVPQKYIDMYNHIQDTKRRTYLGMVTAMDEAVGRVVTALKASGHYDNSAIVFTSDNGGPTRWGGNNWPLRGNKTTLWEGGTRASAFIHSPLLKETRKVSNRLIHAVDWLPTFIELAGGSPPSGIDGVSQWGALNNPSTPDARSYFIYDIDNTTELRAAVRKGKYKLILGNPGPGKWIPPPEKSDNLAQSINLVMRVQENRKIKQNWWSYLVELFESRNGHFNGTEVRPLLWQYITKKKNLENKEKKIMLFDLESDPTEHVDLSRSRQDVVNILTHMIKRELSNRYVTKDDPPRVAAANPDRYGGNWTPGWC